MLSNPRLVAAITLMALGAGLSARRWVTAESERLKL